VEAGLGDDAALATRPEVDVGLIGTRPALAPIHPMNDGEEQQRCEPRASSLQ